jgi:IMP dehydrogenase/GMP reductase
MTDSMPAGQKEREAETAKVKKNEGSGTVPNVTAGPADQADDDETEELKDALHQVEEEKGDWAKSRG